MLCVSPGYRYKKSLDHLLQEEDRSMWDLSLTNEIGQLAQAIGKTRPLQEKIAGTDTLFFIKTKIYHNRQK